MTEIRQTPGSSLPPYSYPETARQLLESTTTRQQGKGRRCSTRNKSAHFTRFARLSSACPSSSVLRHASVRSCINGQIPHAIRNMESAPNPPTPDCNIEPVRDLFAPNCFVGSTTNPSTVNPRSSSADRFLMDAVIHVQPSPGRL